MTTVFTVVTTLQAASAMSTTLYSKLAGYTGFVWIVLFAPGTLRSNAFVGTL